MTGDRPEAWEFGPLYRRLADALARFGTDPVAEEISFGAVYEGASPGPADAPARAELDDDELETIDEVFRHYGSFEHWQLSHLTREDGDAPWRTVRAGGTGVCRDISHQAIRAQFLLYAQAAKRLTLAAA